MSKPRTGTKPARGGVIAGSKVAAFWLFALLLAITVTPRLRLGGGGDQVVDLRLQDLLLVPIILFLLSNRQHYAPLNRLWGRLMPAFFWLFAISFLMLLAFTFTDPTPLRRILFAGRGIEIFVIAAVVAGLYLRAGPRALRATLGALHIAAAANFAWVLVQVATGRIGTLLGGDVGDAIESYGPKLIGEPSAFGTGQFFAFVAALGVAELRARTRQPLIAWAMIGIGAAGAFLAESRVSMVAVAVVVVLMLIISSGRSLLNPVGVTFVALGGVVAALTVVPELDGRLTPEAVLYSLGFRFTDVWKPLVDAILANPFVGVGPGGLVRPLPVEAHNIILRAFLDYGLILGTMFLAFFVVVVVKAWKSIRRPGDDQYDHRLFANLTVVFIVSIFISGMFQDALTGVTSSHLAMVAIGLFAAVNVRATMAADDGLVETPTFGVTRR